MLRLPPIPSCPHTDEAGAEQEQGGGFGDRDQMTHLAQSRRLTLREKGVWVYPDLSRLALASCTGVNAGDPARPAAFFHTGNR